MKKTSYALILCALGALAACAAPPTSQTLQTTGFTLTSPGRADNDMLERAFAGSHPTNPNCVGSNVSPALNWMRAPTGTRSFVILMDDQAGRAGLGVNHWTAYGIPASVDALAQGEATTGSAKFVFGKNTLGALAYLGPCTPKGNAPQHYVYTLIATRLEPGALPPGLTKAEALEALKGQTIAAASLVLRFAHQ